MPGEAATSLISRTESTRSDSTFRDRTPSEDHRQENVIPTATDSELLRYHDIHLPKCVTCFRHWPYPREVSFLAGLPRNLIQREDQRHRSSLSSFEPVTKEAIVVYQTWDRQTKKPHLREEIFARLKLTHTLQTQHKIIAKCKGRLEHYRLVTEFDYNRKTGDVITHFSEFFNEEQEKDFRYAKLITLNSWYMMLLKNILTIIIDIFSIVTGVMMLGQLYSQTGGFQNVKFVEVSRDWFSLWYFGILFVALLLSARAAYWEWKANSSPNVGDIVIKCNVRDRALAFTALTGLIFLGVDKLIKDVVVILHPWKSVQPYAAVKFEGVRAHVVGYKSRPLFYVENATGQYYVLLAQGLNRIVSFIYKASLILAIAIQSGYFNFLAQMPAAPAARAPVEEPSPDPPEPIQIQFTLVVSTVFSMIAAVVAIKKIHKLSKQRKNLEIELLRVLKTDEDKAKQENRQVDSAKQGPAMKLLALHFHKEYREGKLLKVNANKKFKVPDDKQCSTCGRAWEHTMDTLTKTLTSEQSC